MGASDCVLTCLVGTRETLPFAHLLSAHRLTTVILHACAAKVLRMSWAEARMRLIRPPSCAAASSCGQAERSAGFHFRRGDWDGPHSAQTLDAFAREASLPKVHFVKIDTEGAELFVLKAAATVAPSASTAVAGFPGGAHAHGTIYGRTRQSQQAQRTAGCARAFIARLSRHTDGVLGAQHAPVRLPVLRDRTHYARSRPPRRAMPVRVHCHTPFVHGVRARSALHPT